MGHKYLIDFGDHQWSGLNGLKSQTNESVATWVKRMVDYCFQPEVVCNLVIPMVSGQVKVEQ